MWCFHCLLFNIQIIGDLCRNLGGADLSVEAYRGVADLSHCPADHTLSICIKSKFICKFKLTGKFKFLENSGPSEMSRLEDKILGCKQ